MPEVTPSPQEEQKPAMNNTIEGLTLPAQPLVTEQTIAQKSERLANRRAIIGEKAFKREQDALAERAEKLEAGELVEDEFSGVPVEEMKLRLEHGEKFKQRVADLTDEIEVKQEEAKASIADSGGEVREASFANALPQSPAIVVASPVETCATTTSESSTSDGQTGSGEVLSQKSSDSSSTASSDATDADSSKTDADSSANSTAEADSSASESQG